MRFRPFPDRFFRVLLGWRQGEGQGGFLASAHLLLLKLEGVDTVEAGDALRGRVLYLARADAKLPQGRFFVQDLLGLSAVDADTGHVYGKVTDVFPTGSNDVYQVTDENGRDYLVPAIREVIVRVDVDGGVLELRPMRGIFDDAD